MTKHSYLKQEIRARMAITGESYSAAARAIAKDEPLPSEAKTTSSAPQETAELRALVIFTERLAVLLSGAMTVRAAFEVSEQTTEDPVLKRGIREVLEANEANTPMEEAIAARPWAFPGIFSAVVNNGLKNGSFYDSMKQMAQLYRTEMELESPKTISPFEGWTPSRTEHATQQPTRKRDVFDWSRDDSRPLAIYVGASGLRGNQRAKEIAELKSDWKFQQIPDLKELEKYLKNSSWDLSSISAVIAADSLYSTERDMALFEQLAARLSPRVFFAVDLGYKRHRPAIVAGVNRVGSESKEPLGKIFFIDKDRPMATLEDAVDEFIHSDLPEAEVAITTLRSARDIAKIYGALSEQPSAESHPNISAARERLEARIRAEERGLLRLEVASPNPEIRAEARRLEELQENPFNWRRNDTRPLAVYIGPKEVGVDLAKVQTEWKFVHCETPEQFFSFLQHGDIKSDEVCSVIVLDKYYTLTRSGEDFETVAATMAPYCLFGIVSYDASLQEPIRTAIAEVIADVNSPEGEIYFIDSERPKSSLDEAIDDFLLSEPKLAESSLKAIAAAR